jgi:hypothetical protein
MAICELCAREEVAVTGHHLIPRAVHRKGRTARTFERAELNDLIAMLCRACHKFVHSVLTEKDLATEYNTLESLRTHPEIKKFIRWVSTKPPGLSVSSAKSVRRGVQRL